MTSSRYNSQQGYPLCEGETHAGHRTVRLCEQGLPGLWRLWKREHNSSVSVWPQEALDVAMRHLQESFLGNKRDPLGKCQTGRNGHWTNIEGYRRGKQRSGHWAHRWGEQERHQQSHLEGWRALYEASPRPASRLGTYGGPVGRTVEFYSKKSEAGIEQKEPGTGTTWVWTGVDAPTRLIVHFFVGGRTMEDGRTFLEELTRRLNANKPLFTSDELAHYATLLREIYHTKVHLPPTGKRGRPKSPEEVTDKDLDYATVHKTREGNHVVKVERKIVLGDANRIGARLETSPCSSTINTAFVERVNGILRQLDAHLRRKTLTFAKTKEWFEAKMSLCVANYNFIRPHGTLSRNADRTSTPRTPAMQAGVLDRVWEWKDVLARPQVCNG